MRVSIAAADDIIVIDKKVMTVDCTPLRAKRVSAIQWYDDHGEIEFEQHHKPNEVFHSLEQFQSLVDGAKAIPPPKPPTPQELDEMNNRYLLEHPDARRAWIERDTEVQRLFEEAMARDPRAAQAINDNAPSPVLLPEPKKQEKPKTKPKKK